MTQGSAAVAAATRPTPARGQTIARAVWWAALLMYGALFVAGLPLQYARLQAVCDPGACTDQAWFLMTSAETAALARLGIAPGARAAYHLALEALVAAVYVGIGLLLFLRRGDERMAYLTGLALVGLGLWMIPDTPHALEEAGYLPSALAVLLWLPLIPLLGMILFLLPDGRFAPRWLRWIALVFCVAMVVLGIVPRVVESPDDIQAALLAGVILPSVAVAAYGQVYRYRHVASLAQRQQIKWVGIGAIAFITGPLAYGIAKDSAPIPPGEAQLAFDMAAAAVGTVFTLSLPVSLAFAILRYRLWDVDVILRRTLTYAALTGSLGLVYLGSVVVLQAVLARFTGQRQSEFVTVVSTLAIAALFVPVRGRIQQAIDRRFFRARVDAAQALSGFAASARDETDLGRLTERLVQVVHETMQPASVGLWVRSSDPKGHNRVSPKEQP